LDTVGGKRLAQRRAGVSGLTLRTALPATAGWESTVIPSAAGGAIGGRNHLGGVTAPLGGGAATLSAAGGAGADKINKKPLLWAGRSGAAGLFSFGKRAAGTPPQCRAQPSRWRAVLSG